MPIPLYEFRFSYFVGSYLGTVISLPISGVMLYLDFFLFCRFLFRYSDISTCHWSNAIFRFSYFLGSYFGTVISLPISGVMLYLDFLIL